MFKEVRTILFLAGLMASYKLCKCKKWPNIEEDEMVFIHNPIEANLPGHWIPGSILKKILEIGFPKSTRRYTTEYPKITDVFKFKNDKHRIKSTLKNSVIKQNLGKEIQPKIGKVINNIKKPLKFYNTSNQTPLLIRATRIKNKKGEDIISHVKTNVPTKEYLTNSKATNAITKYMKTSQINIVNKIPENISMTEKNSEIVVVYTTTAKLNISKMIFSGISSIMTLTTQKVVNTLQTARLTTSKFDAGITPSMNSAINTTLPSKVNRSTTVEVVITRPNITNKAVTTEPNITIQTNTTGPNITIQANTMGPNKNIQANTTGPNITTEATKTRISSEPVTIRSTKLITAADLTTPSTKLTTKAATTPNTKLTIEAVPTQSTKLTTEISTPSNKLISEEVTTTPSLTSKAELTTAIVLTTLSTKLTTEVVTTPSKILTTQNLTSTPSTKLTTEVATKTPSTTLTTKAVTKTSRKKLSTITFRTPYKRRTTPRIIKDTGDPFYK